MSTLGHSEGQGHGQASERASSFKAASQTEHVESHRHDNMFQLATSRRCAKRDIHDGLTRSGKVRFGRTPTGCDTGVRPSAVDSTSITTATARRHVCRSQRESRPSDHVCAGCPPSVAISISGVHASLWLHWAILTAYNWHRARQHVAGSRRAALFLSYQENEAALVFGPEAPDEITLRIDDPRPDR